MNFRTKPSVEAGIKFTAHSKDGLTRIVEYQPGNGTRYVVTVISTEFSGKFANEALGFSEWGYIVSFPEGAKYKSLCLNSGGGYISADYVQEKTECRSVNDAAVLAELLAYLTGRTAEKVGP
jgi:hypothetical protein